MSNPIPLCPDCVDCIGGAAAGPDAEWRPAMPGEACMAADCATAHVGDRVELLDGTTAWVVNAEEEYLAVVLCSAMPDRVLPPTEFKLADMRLVHRKDAEVWYRAHRVRPEIDPVAEEHVVGDNPPSIGRTPPPLLVFGTATLDVCLEIRHEPGRLLVEVQHAHTGVRLHLFALEGGDLDALTGMLTLD